MSFHYRDNRLYAEDVAVADIASAHGTPCYVYSRAIIEANYAAYHRAFGRRTHKICYAVKANGNLGVLDILARMGAAFDIVSAGELERVRAAGGALDTITFAGVGKTRPELEQALAAGIACFNVESTQELQRLAEVAAAMGVIAPVAVRVNPDVNANTHPYISTGLKENKFGVPMAEALAAYLQIERLPSLRTTGVACHIGSQLTSTGPIVDAAARVMSLVQALEGDGITIEHVDIGGGLGIAYGDESPPPIDSYVQAICQALDPRYDIVIEPGRSIVGEAGVLLSTVQYMKTTPSKTFAICDAAMTELIRPALYQADHVILTGEAGGQMQTVDVVGPVCESADFLARDRELAVANGDLLAFKDSGAYGFVMASNYNARPRPPELLVDGSELHVIRERETYAQLYAGEHLLPGH